MGIGAGLKAFNLQGWIEKNRHRLQPPVNNQLLFEDAGMIVMAIGARMLGANVRKFALGFTVVFFLAYACLIAGAWAYIAATPNKPANRVGRLLPRLSVSLTVRRTALAPSAVPSIARVVVFQSPKSKSSSLRTLSKSGRFLAT